MRADCNLPLYCFLHDPAVADEDKVQTLCHCWDHIDTDRWGPWSLDVDGFLDHDDTGYYIPFDRCTTSAHVLDWIMQIAGKQWADDACLAGLVRAFDDVLYPQGNLCSFGRSKELSQGDIDRLVEKAGHRYLATTVE